MKKLESRIESLETEIAELKSMVALLVDNHHDSFSPESTTSGNSSNQQAGGNLQSAGRDITYSPVFNIYLNGEEGELLSLLRSGK